MSQLYFRYLSIPSGYGPTDRLRWSKTGEAIETHEGRTFIFRANLPSFLEGIATQRPLFQFVYLLDLLHLLGHSDEPWDGIPRRQCQILREAYRGEGAPLRNAGAFFGSLCKGIPLAADLKNDGDLTKWLAAVPALPMYVWNTAEKPPLDAVGFHQLIGNLIHDISEEELRHWFRFGRPALQDDAKRMAKAIEDSKPPATHGLSLDELLRQRPRLAGALPLVEKLVAALSLPPRRQPPQLPLGGYADVTNRGEPERLLPSQFALDGDEFVRRFAEKELMYFRKEEPHRRTHEQIVLLLDQGVRTWGTVRLALSAAVLAFRDLAVRQKRRFLVRCSSSLAERADPSSCDLSTLVDHLEASDFSINPTGLLAAEASENELENADVVLLTHPRSLLDEPVKKRSSSLLSGNKRLFALAVDEEGLGQFSQMRGGEPAPISRFRLDFRETAPPPVEAPLGRRSWTGDVEAISFPFALGPFQKIVALAFDADSEHMLIATQRGYLHLYDLASGQVEMLPRGVLNGELLATVDVILGFHGGFVVTGKLGPEPVAVHYDLRRHKVKVRLMGTVGNLPTRWFGFAELDIVIVRQLRGVDIYHALEVRTGTVIAALESSPPTNENVRLAYEEARDFALPRPWIPTRVAEPHLTRPQFPFVIVRPKRGDFFLFNSPLGKLWQLIEDGQTVPFVGTQFHAQLAENTFAFAAQTESNSPLVWRLFHVADQVKLLGQHNLGKQEGKHDVQLCRLSPDGKLFAMPTKHEEITIRAVGEGGANRLVTARARLHSNLAVYLGETRLEIVFGRKRHAFSWREGPLEHQFRRMVGGALGQVGMAVARRNLNHAQVRSDPLRFSAVASVDMEVLVDIAGQVIVRDFRRDRLVCMFLIRRHEFAAWMPDGTRFGPTDLIGGPATPDALNRLGAALREASLPKV
jgi:hypothetical protein